jgi:hypothetical protein
MNEDYNDYKMKETFITERDIDELREIFKIEYAKKKGWNPDNLTIEQVNEISSDPKWKSGNFLLKS